MSRILLTVALAAEARPFLSRFQLSRVERRGARFYRGSHCCLVQTGIGKLSAAAAVASILASESDVTAVINVGIGGADAGIGQVLLAHCVEDAASGRHWYPHLPPSAVLPGVDTCRVLTLDQPGTHYRCGTLFDMEASGVWSAAGTWLDTSRIHCIKVVSDAPAKPLPAFDRRSVSTLLEAAVPATEALMRTLQQRGDTPCPDMTAIDAVLGELTRRVHHSVTETHRLRRLLQRLDALLPGGLTVTTDRPGNNPMDAWHPGSTVLQACQHTPSETCAPVATLSRCAGDAATLASGLEALIDGHGIHY